MVAEWLEPREGVIIEWPLNGLSHKCREVIIKSRTGVREMRITIMITNRRKGNI